jgi:hypothetical protein
MPYCDFCERFLETEMEGWTYESDPFSKTIIANTRFNDADAQCLACDACAALIEAKTKRNWFEDWLMVISIFYLSERISRLK